MTRTAQIALGAVSIVPAAVTASLPAATDALLAVGSGAVALPLVAVLVASLGAVLAFVWLAAGADGHRFGWKLGWVLALTLFGAAAAPVFWYAHVWRRPGLAG